ncbi:MAG: AAA family ATPase [Bryobacterales bacterium]|nr:AAA family ATPase [Bryobacterales bacterium]
MKNENRKDTVARARAELEASGLSQSAAAREIGISDSALSQWLAGKYEGDSAAVESRVGIWLRSRTRRKDFGRVMPDPPAWVETPTALRIIAGLGYAQLAGDVAVVIGGAGCGKTVAARRYAARQPSVWVAAATSGTKALGPCLRALAKACGLKPGRRTLAGLEEAIAGRVRSTGGLLVVDEAQHLSLRALDSVRGIHDATGVGVALLGGWPLYSRMAGRWSEELAQLHSRVGRLVKLGRPTARDVDALLGGWRLDAARLRRTAVEIASSPGGLRALTKALRNAHMLSGGRKPTVENVREAWEEMGG